MQANSDREAWFIRHAESVGNAGARTQEASSYPLSELGFRQARQLAAALPLEPDLILVSPYVRAQQTADFAIRRFPNVRVEVWPVQEVQYLDPALCVGTTQDERNVLADAYWDRCEPDYAAPDAESFTGFIARAADTLQRLGKRTEKRIFVFCHGRMMDAFAWLNLTRPSVINVSAMRQFSNFFRGFTVPNCSVLPLHFHPDGRRSMGAIWVPDGVEPEAAGRHRPGQEGV